MSIPITKRVMMGGSKKGCGCSSNCSCNNSPAQFNAGLKAAAANGKLDNNPKFKAAVESAPVSPANMWGAAKVAHGEKGSPAKQTILDGVKNAARGIAGGLADAAVDATVGPAIRAFEGLTNKARKNNQRSSRLPSLVSHSNDNNRVTPATPKGQKKELIGPKNKMGEITRGNMTKTISRKKAKPVNSSLSPQGAVSLGSNALNDKAPGIKKPANTAKPMSKKEALKLNRQQRRAIRRSPNKMGCGKKR